MAIKAYTGMGKAKGLWNILDKVTRSSPRSYTTQFNNDVLFCQINIFYRFIGGANHNDQSMYIAFLLERELLLLL